MICVAAMLPLYQRLGMNTLIMTALMLLCSGVMNLTPWVVLLLVLRALQVDPSHIFVPMILPMIISIGWLFFLAYLYGRYEQNV